MTPRNEALLEILKPSLLHAIYLDEHEYPRVFIRRVLDAPDVEHDVTDMLAAVTWCAEHGFRSEREAFRLVAERLREVVP